MRQKDIREWWYRAKFEVVSFFLKSSRALCEVCKRLDCQPQVMFKICHCKIKHLQQRTALCLPEYCFVSTTAFLNFQCVLQLLRKLEHQSGSSSDASVERKVLTRDKTCCREQLVVAVPGPMHRFIDTKYRIV